jgi:hypothetical protein
MRSLRDVRVYHWIVWYVTDACIFKARIEIDRLGTFLSMLALLLAALSVWISTSLVFGYIAWRLFVLIKADGRAGVSQWSAETKQRFRRQRKETEERRGRSPGPGVQIETEDTKSPPDQTANEIIKQ